MSFFQYLRQQEDLFNQQLFFSRHTSHMSRKEYQFLQDRISNCILWDNIPTRLSYLYKSIQELFIPFSNASLANGLMYRSITMDLKSIIVYSIFAPIEAYISFAYGHPKRAFSMLMTAAVTIMLSFIYLIIDLILLTLSLFTRTISTLFHGIKYLTFENELCEDNKEDYLISAENTA
jgi:hypothetical protein